MLSLLTFYIYYIIYNDYSNDYDRIIDQLIEYLKDVRIKCSYCPRKFISSWSIKKKCKRFS